MTARQSAMLWGILVGIILMWLYRRMQERGTGGA